MADDGHDCTEIVWPKGVYRTIQHRLRFHRANSSSWGECPPPLTNAFSREVLTYNTRLCYCDSGHYTRQTMNPSERQHAIVEHLDAVGACSYQDLAGLLDVSEMTIRRDVDKLVAAG